MADKTIGELPSLSTMEDDTLIPVEHDGEAKSMAGTVLQDYVYDLVQDDIEAIAETTVGPKGEDGVSPTLSSSKSGKVTTIYYTDVDHTSSTVLATLRDGADGSGIGDMLKSVYDPNERYEDIFAYCDAHGLRSATVIVAASNSKSTSSADFVCSGVSDQLTIQQAINSLPNTGGRVLLLEGTYYLDCEGITPEDGVYTLISVPKSRVSICGQGISTQIHLTDVASVIGEGHVDVLSISAGRFQASDFLIISDNTAVDATGLVFNSYDAEIMRVKVWNFDGGVGVSTTGDNVTIIACAVESCGVGLLLKGGYQKVQSCNFEYDSTGLVIEDGRHIVGGCTFLGSYLIGLNVKGGKRCIIKGNFFEGQGKGMQIDGATDFFVTDNVVFRASGDTSWGSAEYPIVCLNSTRLHIINNYVYGKAITFMACSGTVLSYSGNDWNPTV